MERMAFYPLTILSDRLISPITDARRPLDGLGVHRLGSLPAYECLVRVG